MENSSGDIQTSTAKLPGKLRAFIFRESAHLSEDEPVYAINWFNTKSSLIYDFYNWLAVRSVRKIGGEPFFKGRHVKTLHGSAEDTRDVLLVVRYPALKNFRTMLESKVFQMVSLIRMAAVKDFIFGFTKRGDAGPDLVPFDAEVDSGFVFGVLHYSGVAVADTQLAEMTAQSTAQIFYNGQIRAHIATGESPEGATQVPCIMDGITIFKSTDALALEQLLENPAFQGFTAQADRFFFAVYTRTL